ncbi:hypothetical protein MW887_000931 [Aspergillus wentii]|nr:hypothetical protein MW887_000931 [Aspergillus wentii]
MEAPMHFLLVYITEKRSRRFRGFLCAVEWDLREQVMDDMVADDLVEEMSTEKACASIDGCESPSSEGPALGSVVRDGGVGVVE